jgi:hypothetical protein
MDGTTRSLPAARANDRAVWQLSAVLVLLVQFAPGMVDNLYVTVPRDHPGAYAHDYFAGIPSGIGWAIAHGPFALAAHASLGLAVVVAGVATLIHAIRLRRRPAVVTSLVAAIAIVGAAFNGLSFINYHHDFSSLIMAGLFAVALASYAIGLFLTVRDAG